MDRGAGGGLLRVDARLLVDHREALGAAARGLRAPEYEKARRLEGVVEYLEHTPLGLRAEGDQEVAIADQVELGEWRILHEDELYGGAQVADRLGNLIVELRLREEA